MKVLIAYDGTESADQLGRASAAVAERANCSVEVVRASPPEAD